MDVYSEAINLLLSQELPKHWPELREALKHALVRRPVAWHFPVKACEAVGAAPELAREAVAAITCAHMSIILVDDILDQDPRGAYLQIGVGRAANLAVGLNCLGLETLLHLNNASQREAVLALNDMIFRTAYGQELDVQNAGSEQGYWTVARAKSSPYFGAAMFLGAICGRATLKLASALRDFGEIYGEIMQIHDDLNDCLATPANVDWLQGRNPLPILFAQTVDHPQRERFVEMRGKVEDPQALEEAQSILISSGAISFCAHELITRNNKAKALLHNINLKRPEALEGLLEEAIAPVRRLFAKVGVDLNGIETFA